MNFLVPGGAGFIVVRMESGAEIRFPVADNDRLELARIAFKFNRRDYGRLRQLIDVLNGL